MPSVYTNTLPLIWATNDAFTDIFIVIVTLYEMSVSMS